MKKKTLTALCVMCALALLVCGCKSEEQIAQSSGSEPTVISPDVNITQAALDEPDTLNVSGSGKVTLAPDMATVSIEVTLRDEKPEEAQRLNTEVMDAVLAAVKAAGVAEKDIKTERVELDEVYNYDKSPAVIVGYEMRNVVQVTIRDISRVGAVMGDAVAAGATGTYGLTFTVSDSGGAYQNALKAAIEDASGKAKAMAEALGVELIAVPLSVQENGSGSTPMDYRDAPAADMAASKSSNSVAVSTGELTVEARVSITYEITNKQ